MVNSRLLLGFVAFIVSFVLSLVTSRDVGRAIATAFITLPAVYLAAAVVHRRSLGRLEQRIFTLKEHIYALQQRRMEVYQEFAEIAAEKEQAALMLNSIQHQLQQRHLPSAPLPSQPNLSWDLSMPPGVMPVPPYALPTELQVPAEPENLDVALSEAVVRRRKIESSLNALQAELQQLNTQVVEQRQTRNHLARELTTLTAQKQQLEETSGTLKADIQELERCRDELEQFLSYTETKKQELETGSHPLQIALKQLQTQINTLHTELGELDTQIEDRRRLKEDLDRTLSAPRSGTSSKSGGKNGQTAKASAKAVPLTQAVNTSVSSPPAVPVTLPSLSKSEKSADLPAEWTQFMLQLPEYEFQVLKAIVEQPNPAPLIKQVAEANLTMPELLLDSINERALDTIGDLIIDSGNGRPAAIVRDYQSFVAALVHAYEF
ncbi:hypothetical protein H6F43_20175 [Leptolyngbya sp. FACHB-36]|uniref:tellurite resistance TerB C-terminal domain-containing protein n=1 Tax=Leptolyngbya sp. FACHB-36 TaxID=2692808 RepID=UPI0016817D9E|nr:tellurite resistance TerB C-terminal domain-containing protein [Leptolyngbya sp. FACHB-36]MBD2022501.1 hypothetical protein [Leptolyngbya sp. FACHB-36]